MSSFPGDAKSAMYAMYAMSARPAMSVTSSECREQQLHQLRCVSCQEGRVMGARGGGFLTCQNSPWVSEKSVGPRLRHGLRPPRKINCRESLCVRCEKNPGMEFYDDDEAFTFHGDETWNANVVVEEEGDIPPSPWLGAVLFRRSSIQRHYDLHTTLERLHLHRFSSELSRNLAHTMGINLSENQLTSTDNDAPPSAETPVSVSMDVTRKGKDLHLEGMVRTAMSVPCNRCLSPVAERVFADFRLTLMPNPPQEPSAISIGVSLDDDGNTKPLSNNSSKEGGVEGLTGVLDIDIDDKLHFPPEAKEMDLSSYVRDTIHLEIPLFVHCDANCKGLCMQCGANLNLGACTCETVSDDRPWGPLEQLKKQLEEK
ncbi:hypothetical protein CBR_g57847 [Chara braunii]|uniref:DUF177 domain-containing protein n=1 Tax=Chara braunii TaxID=69332 RepID=A0A388K854_CHABU|nr:hypothetical protein CBR_g57847 [Chara braunii]|eukprot:GBG66245.1 hypothetical protein CBR_g57847 [Chara braunii]